ncbi:2-amino-4-hydroxy-6-hydroxymethyldihydropteridine diphosphokinase [Caldalkalibacillus salinus]|uniref:2-amino-4-hydroxy-6- hydroxymethyldihydropteridine diphosphokinase n=1 Tax=Caldalkalibacillus salinus TaxID=2803787 RepID=UPI001F02616F|nr:2-amino-4-hydroxy-6-hydroxymethyldihydropteridine diphosphokinase [Caldalkalibacillus salinus]
MMEGEGTPLWETFYLSLGSNMGDRASFLSQAMTQLNQIEQLELTKMSAIYETDPVGYENQSRFLNMVVAGQTALEPETLLTHIQRIERSLGRERLVRWGPRTIDIDILLYNSISMDTRHLKIPHPRMKERAFVVVPLAEIAPDLQVPGTTYTAEALCHKVKGEGVHIWKSRS